MILYFSATGNSRYAAQRLAAALNDRAVSITGSDGKTTLRRGERLGIVTPTYAWELPEPVRKFLKNAQFTAVNRTPFVRQYGILFKKWGVFVCRKRKSKRHIVENSK